MTRIASLSLTLGAAACLVATAAAQPAKQMVFPAKGQDAKRQAADEKTCHDWAVLQVGLDPMKTRAPSPPAASAPPQQAAPTQAAQGSGAKGALRGAARGAAVASIAGGKWEDGAMAGGAAGAVRGRRASRRQQAQQQQSAAQQQAAAQQAAQQQYQAQRSAYDAQVSDYYRARAACLEAKGYQVK